MIERRRMLGMAIAGLAGASIPGTLDAAGSAPLGADEWLESIARKKVRAFLDIPSFLPAGTPFRKASNLQRALIDAHGAKPETDLDGKWAYDYDWQILWTKGWKESVAP